MFSPKTNVFTHSRHVHFTVLCSGGTFTNTHYPLARWTSHYACVRTLLITAPARVTPSRHGNSTRPALYSLSRSDALDQLVSRIFPSSVLIQQRQTRQGEMLSTPHCSPSKNRNSGEILNERKVKTVWSVFLLLWTSTNNYKYTL
jgi:hypothetical protein